jgi:hypothetical protein
MGKSSQEIDMLVFNDLAIMDSEGYIDGGSCLNSP